MTGRVTVLFVDPDGTTTCFTARHPLISWDDRGALGIGGDHWERTVHPAPGGDDTGPCTGCGRGIDRTRPYITDARHLEVTGPGGTDVLEARPLGQYHPSCAPGDQS